MNNIARFLTVALLGAFVSSASAVVGYVNRSFQIGESLFSNPLQASPNNTLSNLFPSSTVPEGTVVSLWNPTSLTFDTSSTYELGEWSLNFTLNPGTGAKLTTSTLFTSTFVGTLVTRDGNPFTEPPALPPVYSGPNGVFLLGDKFPMASTGDDIFRNILGRLPNVGEQVITLTTVSTYNEGWDVVPSLSVAGAVFLNVGPVPEPTVAALAVLGVALFRGVRRRR